MKKLLLIFGAASLAAATPVIVPTPAQAQGATDDLAFCRDVILPQFPQANLGLCMGFNRSSDEGFNTFICQNYRLEDPVGFDEEFDTFGDCVKFQHSFDD